MRLKGRLGIISKKDDSEIFYPRDHTMFKDVDPDSEEYFERGSYTGMEMGKISSITQTCRQTIRGISVRM